MFRSIYTKILRDHRVGVVVWGLVLGGLTVAVAASFDTVAGTPAAQASLRQLSRSFAWYAEPLDALTPGVFATWRLGPMLAIFPAIWGLLAGSGTLRGEEERGSLDVLLATPHSRARVAIEKVAGVFSAALLLGLLCAVVVAVAGLAGGSFGAVEAGLFGLNIALHAMAYVGLALLVSQFTRERGTAAGITGGLLALAFVLDASGRVAETSGLARAISTIYLYNLTRPLAGAGANPGALASLLALGVLAAVAAVILFTRRDVGAAFPLLPERWRARWELAPRTRHTERDWSLRSPAARALRVAGGASLWWAVGLAAYAGWMTGIASQVQAAFVRLAESSPLLAAATSGQLLAGRGGEGFVGLVVFTFLPLLVSAYALTRAAAFRADEDAGRLELPLATQHPRVTLLLTHVLALAATVAAIVLVALGAIWIAARASDLAVDGTRLVGAGLALLPLALAVGALGYALAGWCRSGMVVGLLAAVLVGSLLLSFLGPTLNLPRSLAQLSLLEQYGTPLTTGVDGWAMARLGALAASALALAAYRFATKDLAH